MQSTFGQLCSQVYETNFSAMNFGGSSFWLRSLLSAWSGGSTENFFRARAAPTEQTLTNQVANTTRAMVPVTMYISAVQREKQSKVSIHCFFLCKTFFQTYL